MTFVNVGWLGTIPGRRDELVAHLTQHSPALAEIGCLAYEVGVNADEPDRVYVVEQWTSVDAHRASLGVAEVQDSIEHARPLLSGDFGGFRFDIIGSPLSEA